MPKTVPDIRGLLIHISHYDPVWFEAKDDEEPFDLATAVELVAVMNEVGMNLLVVDCADGVRYKSHPELRRPYTVPMADLRKLAGAAHALGIDVVPKLNFARSGRHHHDDWMRPHSDPRPFWNDMKAYWKVAGELIGELVGVCRPKRFFHVGMDEDHDRSLAQYADAVRTLRGIVGRHGLRTVIWNDSCHSARTSGAQVHADKSRAAEGLIPRDIVQVVWDYGHAHPSVVKRLVKEGFEVWAAPGRTREGVRRWRRAVVAEGASGMLMTRWVKCGRTNRKALVQMLRNLAAEYT